MTMASQKSSTRVILESGLRRVIRVSSTMFPIYDSGLPEIKMAATAADSPVGESVVDVEE
jgi:hypothetical protein